MERTLFHIEQMDCAAEEQLIRMRLDGLDGVDHLVFDLPKRQLEVYHTGHLDALQSSVESLGLGARVLGHEASVLVDAAASAPSVERRPLMAALAINALLFTGEMIAGVLSGSMGLVADSLDMLADALVYGLSLAAVGRTVDLKKRVARQSGYLQLALAVFGLAEVVRRVIGGEGLPDVMTMIVVSSVALLGNVITLLILRRARSEEAHVQASWIFTSNDVKVNLLVIASAVAVYLTSSEIPDLVAGAFIFAIVANGARRILALSKGPAAVQISSRP